MADLIAVSTPMARNTADNSVAAVAAQDAATSHTDAPKMQQTGVSPHGSTPL